MPLRRAGLAQGHGEPSRTLRIAMIASEAVPFAKTGGLADVVGALPIALERLGHEVCLVLPKYKGITAHEATLGRQIRVWFVEHPGYFGRDHLYGGPDGDYADNLERFSYFSWRALEQLQRQGFHPDVIHVHDWQAGLVPVYLACGAGGDTPLRQATTVLTVHNLSYQGIFPKSEFPKLGVPWDLFHMDGLEYYDRVNLLKGGLLFAKRLTTVSPTYAREIQTPEYGCGLDGVLRKRQADLTGIVNGIDTVAWDPATDAALAARYSAREPSGKGLDKQALQAAVGLPTTSEVPLIGMVTRLAAQKGLDLVVAALDELLRLRLQLVILGTGDRPLQEQLAALALRYPATLRVRLSFDDRLARQIYAGADGVLMPSRFEPCGLGQMIAMRYGAIPIVRRTGGLADTVVEAGTEADAGTGFVFEAADPSGLRQAVQRAITAWADRPAWARLVARAMAVDVSWERAARAYVDWYQTASVAVSP